MTKKHYECSDKQMVFTILQMAFDFQMINGRLEPEDLESGKAEWKDRGFYSLLSLEEDTTLEGKVLISDDGDFADYRIAIETAPYVNGMHDSRSPVNVICASDVGFYTTQFTNTEFGCIVNYLKKKHAAGKLCLAAYEKEEEENEEEN